MGNFDKTDDPRRRTLIQALTLGAFSGALPAGSAFAQTLLGSLPGKLPPGRSIYRITGRVTVNGKEATLETPVAANDTIVTGQESEIIFVIGGQALLVRADSQLNLQGNSSAASALVSGLRMLTGKLLSVSRKQPMKLQTATATIGIRGTGVYVEANPELTYFCTCYGVTDVAATDDPASRETVAATRHDRSLHITVGRSSGQNIQPAVFKNHSDEELMLIETLVGRTTPFANASYNPSRRGY